MTAQASSIAVIVREHQQLARDAQAADPTIRGDYDPLELAGIWEELGFTAEEVDQWLDARCYSPLIARDLRMRSITPEQAAVETESGAGEKDTIAFKLSSSQLLLSEALKQLETRAPPAAGRVESLIGRQLVELDEALDALLARLRDLPADAVAVAHATEQLLEIAKQTAIALSYLHRHGQHLGDELPPGLSDELLDTAAELNALHDNHAPKILGLIDRARHPTTAR